MSKNNKKLKTSTKDGLQLEKNKKDKKAKK